ncbi:MAG: polysaccharide deacetylase family protein [Caldilineaceae bacterium]
MSEQLPTNPLLARLGYDADARLVIFHADDVGMCHGSNQAFVELSQFAIIQTGSIMVPCPWASEILRICRDNPALDVGVHLTLTSEWDSYRWGPLSTRAAKSGLLDAEGYFWPSVEEVAAHADAAAAVAEMRAQIEFVRAWGVDFTHIDTHMGTAIAPNLIQHYVQLGLEYQTPVLLSRYLDKHTDGLEIDSLGAAQWRELIQWAEGQGMLLPDWFRITPRYSTEMDQPNRADVYEEILQALPPGVTYFSLHPNQPADIAMIAPDHAETRAFEYQYFQSARLQAFLAAENIVPIGYRQIRDLMRES